MCVGAGKKAKWRSLRRDQTERTHPDAICDWLMAVRVLHVAGHGSNQNLVNYLARHVGSGRPVLERDLGATPEHVLERQRPLALDRLHHLGPPLGQGGDERLAEPAIPRDQPEQLVEPAPVAVREMLERRPRETMTVARERGGGEHLRPGGPPWQGDIAGAGRAT